MEKYGKPIDHCCRFGSKWSAWKCEVFQCCRCEKLLDYLNMEFIYLWMIYIYMIHRRSTDYLQMILFKVAPTVPMSSVAPSCKSMANILSKSAWLGGGPGGGLVTKNPWKNKIRFAWKNFTRWSKCPQKLRSKNRNCRHQMFGGSIGIHSKLFGLRNGLAKGCFYQGKIPLANKQNHLWTNSAVSRFAVFPAGRSTDIVDYAWRGKVMGSCTLSLHPGVETDKMFRKSYKILLKTLHFYRC